MGTPVDFWTLDDCVKALSDIDPCSAPQPRSTVTHKHGGGMSGFSANEDAIRQLLSERERDLEMAAQIGKRLLEQNKDLEARLENLDEQLLSANDRAHQLQHELCQKEQLVQVYSRLCEESQPEDVWNTSSPLAASPLLSPARATTPGSTAAAAAGTTPGSKARGTPLSSGLDQLQRKISDLELENNQLRQEHSSLVSGRSEERKDRSLVEDCLSQLAEANQHIRKLSDELSQKTDKFMARQNDVADLLERSLEMEMRVKQLTSDNLVLNQRLGEAQCSQIKLSDHLVNIRDQYDECLKSLDEAHQEIRLVQQRQTSMPASPARPNVLRPPLPAVETAPLSLAAELRASLDAEVEFEEGVEHVRRCSYPWDARHSRSYSDSCAPGSGGDSEEGGCSGDSEETDERGDRERSAGKRRKASKVRAKRLQEAPSSTPRWRTGPSTDKVQMVKSMEGSQTLRTWQRLARPSMSGALFERRPGVRVRGCSGNRNSGGCGLGFGGLLSSDSETDISEPKSEPVSVRFGLGRGFGVPSDGKKERDRKKAEEEEKKRKAEEEAVEAKRLEAKEKEEAEARRRKVEAEVEAEVAAITFRMSSEPPDPQRTLEKAKRKKERPRSPNQEFPREFLREGADLNLSASAPSLAALLSECGIRSKTYEELIDEGFPVPAPPPPPPPLASKRCPATPRNSPTAELERREITAAPVNPVLVFTGLLESLSDIFRPFSASSEAPTAAAASRGLPRRNTSYGSGLEGLNAVTVPSRPPLPAVLHRTDSSAASPKR